MNKMDLKTGHPAKRATVVREPVTLATAIFELADSTACLRFLRSVRHSAATPTRKSALPNKRHPAVTQ